MNRKVYLSQINYSFGKGCFLPYSAGILWAYAKTVPEVAESYELQELLFLREPIEGIVARMDNPYIFGSSLYCWNNNYSLALSKAVKERFPDCLVIAGGPMVPDKSEGYFSENPYIDVLVHGEGEITFATLLHRLLYWDGKYPIRGVAGISSNSPDCTTYKAPPRDRNDNLDSLPSPYLTGVFDELMYLPYEFHASQETHRGCPYACTFLRLGECHISEGQKIW